VVLEIADIGVKPGLEAEFEAGVAKAAPLFKSAKGCHGLSLQRSHETPTRYLLFVQWETVEAHMVDFRNSPAFAGWRDCVQHCFETPPQVQHVQCVLQAFGS